MTLDQFDVRLEGNQRLDRLFLHTLTGFIGIISIIGAMLAGNLVG